MSDTFVPEKTCLTLSKTAIIFCVFDRRVSGCPLVGNPCFWAKNKGRRRTQKYPPKTLSSLAQKAILVALSLLGVWLVLPGSLFY